MSDVELKAKLKAEIGAWANLFGDAKALQESLNRLRQLQTEILALPQKAAEAANHAIVQAKTALTSGAEALTSSLSALASTPALIRQSTDEIESGFRESLERVTAIGHTSVSSLGTETTQMIENLRGRLEAEVDSLREFLEEDFTTPLSEKYQSATEAVCETYDNLRSNVVENVGKAVEHGEEQARELGDKLDEFGESWKRSVAEIRDSYEGVVGSVNELGREVSTLTEAIGTAMQTTAGGMNVATRSMDDIKSVMEDVV